MIFELLFIFAWILEKSSGITTHSNRIKRTIWWSTKQFRTWLSAENFGPSLVSSAQNKYKNIFLICKYNYYFYFYFRHTYELVLGPDKFLLQGALGHLQALDCVPAVRQTDSDQTPKKSLGLDVWGLKKNRLHACMRPPLSTWPAVGPAWAGPGSEPCPWSPWWPSPCSSAWPAAWCCCPPVWPAGAGSLPGSSPCTTKRYQTRTKRRGFLGYLTAKCTS